MVVYSLVCWGGLTGKVVSISASTDVVTLTNHGLRNGAKLWPSGTLPSELNASTPVYARSTGANTFTLHTSAVGAIANTGQILFAGSSTYAAVTLKSDLVASPSTALAAYGLSDLSRWGSSGSERVYGGLSAWYAVRSSATSVTSDEICEIGEAFNDFNSSSVNISASAASWLITTSINEKRTSGFHFGVLNAGYMLTCNQANTTILFTSAARVTLDGFTVKATASVSNLSGVAINGAYSVAKYMAAIGSFGYVSGEYGLLLYNSATEARHCIVVGFVHGLYYYNTAKFSRFLNCTAVGNKNGALTNNASGLEATYINCVCVGNTTNWQALTGTFINNAGQSNGAGGYTGGTPPGTGAFALSTTDFSNFSGSGTAPNWTTPPDYRPASAYSPQVDSGVYYYGVLPYDFSGGESPNYNNGGAEAVDVGCYEFDHGYGPHPASHTLTLTNVVVGSRVHIRDQADTVTHYDDIASASSVVIPITVYGDSRDNWRIKVRKASAAPYFRPWETIMTATAGSSSIYVSQIPD